MASLYPFVPDLKAIGALGVSGDEESSQLAMLPCNKVLVTLAVSTGVQKEIVVDYAVSQSMLEERVR